MKFNSADFYDVTRRDAFDIESIADVANIKLKKWEQQGKFIKLKKSEYIALKKQLNNLTKLLDKRMEDMADLWSALRCANNISNFLNKKKKE